MARLLPVCALLLLVSLGQRAAAQEPNQESRERWRVRLSPYAWLTGVDGTTTVDGERTDISISFDEFLELTNSGFQLQTTAIKGDWSIRADLTLADLGLEEAGRVFSVDVDLDQIILAVKGGYRVFTHRSAVEDPDRNLPRNHGVDLEWGLRYWDLGYRALVRFDLLAPGGPPPEVIFVGNDRWADLLVGATYAAPLSRRASILAASNLGGFGLGESSRLTWEAAVFFSYVTGTRWSFSGGYRVLFWDRTTTDDEGTRSRSEMMLRGPMVGATYRF